MPLRKQSKQSYAAHAAGLLAAIRERRPLVHHLTNFVTMSDVAAVTRALGASPVMAMAPEEVQEVAAQADALVINLGTPTAERLRAVDLALQAARAKAVPIVIDPVGAGMSRLRTETSLNVIRAAGRPVVRANPAEAAALTGELDRVRGVDAVGEFDVIDLATRLSALGAVAAVTAPRDIVTDGRRVLAIDNGHPWLAAMPGAGCMVTAVVGIFLTVADLADFVTATAAALACFGLAAERARGQARGPGSLKAALLDALFTLPPGELEAGMKCTLLPAHAQRGSERVRHNRPADRTRTPSRGDGGGRHRRRRNRRPAS